MDEEDFEEFFVDFDFQPANRRMIPEDLLVLGVGFLANIAGAIDNTLSTAHQLVAMHANHKTSQAQFRAEAAIEIETLTSGE